jgi:hypothetical protein
MQPGYPGSGQDPYGQQPPYTDPYAQPQYPPPSQQPQPPYQGQDPYAQPQPPYQQPQPPYQGQDPYGQPQQPYQQQDPYGQPTSASPYPTSDPGYPGAGQYPAAGYGAPPPQQNNTLGLVGMILGIISIPAACCAILGIIAGAAALVLGILGMRKASAGQASNRGQALAGVICGSVGLVLSIGSAIAGVAMNFSNFTGS